MDRTVEEEQISLLTQKDKATGNHPTLLTINWDGVTPEMARIAFRLFILHVVQSKFRHSLTPIPLTCYVLAKEMIHQEIELPCKYKVPKKKELWEHLLEQLSSAEREVLFRELTKEKGI